jgi:putative transposase
LVIDQLVEKYWWLCPMRELILDHCSEFGAHRRLLAVLCG